jgi:L-2,4-diaminobutyrate decarboxylase
MLGLPAPRVVPTRRGRCDLDELATALAEIDEPQAVVATAGTTARGEIDPLPEMASLARAAGAWFHVDAAYGGGLLFSNARRGLLAGLHDADSVALDLHKFGWQPLAAGLLTVADSSSLAPLDLVADYLNADDDSEAGLPDLLGRSIRTSRRPDAVKMAVTFRALGRSGLGALVDACCAAAATAADRIVARPGLRLLARPQISTVLFRPVAADGPEGDQLVAAVRRALLASGDAVVGRAVVRECGTSPRLWLKLTILNPTLTFHDVDRLLDLVEAAAAALPEGVGHV